MITGHDLDHLSGAHRVHNPVTSNLVSTNSVRWSEFTTWQSDQMKEVTKMMKETKNVTFIHPSYSLDSITKHADDEAVTVDRPKSKEPSTTSLTQSESAAPTVPTRITERSTAKTNKNAQESIQKQYNEAIGKTHKVSGDSNPVAAQLPLPVTDSDGTSNDEDVTLSCMWLD